MLLKKNRANRKDLEEVFKKSLFLRSSGFNFRYRLHPAPFSVSVEEKKNTFKLSFVVPKSICKSAVKRNSFRRKGYRILKKNIDNLNKPVVGAFVFNKDGLSKTTQELENDIKNILQKI